jgi:hypothetical protein
MRNKLIYPMVAVVLAACGGDGERSARSGQQYETVVEGSASGVTSTIAGPGETLPPITGTNADTTSAFTLSPNVVPQPVPGTGGIPAAPPYADAAVAPMTPMPNTSAAAPRTSAAVSQRQPERTYVPPPMTSSARPVQQEPQRETEPRDSREPQPVEDTTAPAPVADTAAPAPPPTNTAPPPQQREDNQDEPVAEEPPPPPPAL